MRRAILAGGTAILVAGAYASFAISDATWARAGQAQTKHAAAPLTKHATAAPRVCGVTGIDATRSAPLSPAPVSPWSEPGASTCTARVSHGFPIPDPRCTPGAINPDLTLVILRDPGFTTTHCLRDHATSAREKEQAYGWYGTHHPANNTGMTASCELDHLISLELGGADTLDNIWPECGPAGVDRNGTYFHLKDTVENYLADEVRSGHISLAAAQHGIATDWTQFIGAAAAHRRRGGAAVRLHESDQSPQ